MVNVDTVLLTNGSVNTKLVKSLKFDKNVLSEKGSYSSCKISSILLDSDDEYTKINVISFKRCFSRLKKNYSVDR